MIAAVLAAILVVVAVVAGVNAARLHTRNNQLHQTQQMLATTQGALRSSQATVSNQQIQITALRRCLADLVTLGTEINAKNTTAASATVLKVEQECAPLGIG
ncbi:MAG: hypothetical protein ACRDZ8_02770 [Acidimicrobiales bacterium]